MGRADDVEAGVALASISPADLAPDEPLVKPELMLFYLDVTG
jgi:hypothetical protein